VNCLSSPSGPVRDRPCSFASRTSSLAATSSAKGPGFFLAVMSLSVVVITAPSPPTQSARRAGTPLNPQSRERYSASSLRIWSRISFVCSPVRAKGLGMRLGVLLNLGAGAT
jgi:hypothetical protein